MPGHGLVDVVGVRVVDEYVLELDFSDGVSRTVDVERYLTGPVFAAILDPDVFASVSVDPGLGTVVWPNGADLPPEVLRYDDVEPASPDQAPGVLNPGDDELR